MRTLHRFGCLLAAALASGCGDLEPVAPYSPVTDPAQLFMALELDHAAVNLATFDGYRELQLTATPLDALGRPLSGLPAPTYRSSDTTRVFVTQDGLLQARRSASNVQVIAEIVAPGNIRQADTIFVNVRQTSVAPPVLDVLTLQPESPEDAVLGMVGFTGFLGIAQFLQAGGRNYVLQPRVRALDAAGAPISSLVFEYESLTPDVLSVSSRLGIQGWGNLLQPGEASVVVRTTAYGVTKVDTAHFTVTNPVIHGAIVEPGPAGEPIVRPKTIVVRPGGYVFFTNNWTDSISVTFQEPAAAGQIPELCEGAGATYPWLCESGNIPNFRLDEPEKGIDELEDYFVVARGRQFSTPGTYSYTIEPLGSNGTIIVSDVVQ
jgi:hypothetical protein